MKKTCVIQSPLDTFSGYGARSRDFITSLLSIKEKEWDIKLISTPWGGTPTSFLQEYIPSEKKMLSLIIDKLDYQPDIFIQITVPNEFEPKGKYNIGVTAGIETTAFPYDWILGCNRMNHVIFPSKHSQIVAQNTTYKHPTEGEKKLECKSSILFEGININKYKQTKLLSENIKNIKFESDFNFLFVGHWLPGILGHDRKNVGLMIKIFLDVFKNVSTKPGLILKTSKGVGSYIDQELIKDSINQIKSTIDSDDLPPITLIHGELEDEEINSLYNHPQVKAMISLTKGEGFGRPLLEFAATGKPIIASGWSGHTDFLHPQHYWLVGGELENVHESTVNQYLIRDAKWFKPNTENVFMALRECYFNHNKYLTLSENYRKEINKSWSLDAMTLKLKSILKNEMSCM